MTTDEKPQYIYYYTMYTYTNRLEFSLICYKILLGVFAGDFPSKCTTTQRRALQQQWRLFCSCRYIMVRVENGRHRGHCALSTSISHSLSLIHIYPAAICVAVFGCVYILFFAIQTRHTMYFLTAAVEMELDEVNCAMTLLRFLLYCGAIDAVAEVPT
jgi:hypothetical protein